MSKHEKFSKNWNILIEIINTCDCHTLNTISIIIDCIINMIKCTGNISTGDISTDDIITILKNIHTLTDIYTHIDLISQNIEITNREEL